jgi:N-acetylmuramoyl-L-alanine amidase
MRIYVEFPAFALLALAIVSGAVRSVHAQSAAGARYEVLQEQELRVSQSPAATEEDFRVVVNRYWAFVRRYPTSGYADNAIWQAANLSMSVFTLFGADRDRYRALQLFQWLRDEYPHSSFRAQAIAHIEQIGAEPVVEDPARATTASDTTIRAVRREVLPDVIRVTVELDREVPFYQERLDAPARLFFDLKGTRTVPALVDATLRYDSGLVRHIRLGRHPNKMTRIVLDLENVSRYSVYTLYNPYRIVIDAEPAVLRTAGQAPRARDVENGAAKTTVPAPVAPSEPLAAKPSPPPELTALSIESEQPATSPAPIQSDKPVLASKPIAPAVNSTGKFSVARQLGLGVSRIVIDAGHGGHDPGASAFGLSESELVLDVALRLAQLLQQQEGIDVVLTRQTDEFVSLEERTHIANRESADLFLSIHANASANATARGVETYFLNFALNPQAEAVAARENAASGKNMSSLPGIIKAIALNSKLNESREFAASVQRSLVRGLRQSNKSIKNLGVKQAPFMVLVGASMPSVLAEISFVTNRQEARLLQTPAYRQKIAESLLAGIVRYQQSLKKVETVSLRKEKRTINE